MALTFDEICIDAHDAAALGAWWSKVLGWRQMSTTTATWCCTRRPVPGQTGCSSPCPTTRSSRTASTSTSVPTTSRPRWIACSGLGARHVDIGQGEQTWVVLADPEGNEFCILAADD